MSAGKQTARCHQSLARARDHTFIIIVIIWLSNSAQQSASWVQKDDKQLA